MPGTLPPGAMFHFRGREAHKCVMFCWTLVLAGEYGGADGRWSGPWGRRFSHMALQHSPVTEVTSCTLMWDPQTADLRTAATSPSLKTL